MQKIGQQIERSQKYQCMHLKGLVLKFLERGKNLDAFLLIQMLQHIPSKVKI